MGLAASQARLLCITMRITDDQYQLMKLSSQQSSLLAKSADIDEQYDYMKNAVNYSYNGNEKFTYSDLMGASGLTAGLESPVFVTNKDNKIVLDGAYGMAMQSAYMASSGKPKGSATGFNAFVAQITGDSTTNWFAAAQKSISSPKAGNNNATGSSSNTSKIFSGGWDTTVGYNSGVQAATIATEEDTVKLVNDFIDNYGEVPSKSETNSKDLSFDDWTQALDKYGKEKGFRFAVTDGKLYVNGTVRSQTAELDRKESKFTDDQIKGILSNIVSSVGELPAEGSTNTKGVSREDWLKTIYNYSKGIGFKYSVGSNSVTIEGRKLTCANGSGSVGFVSGKSGSINEDGTVNDEKTIKAAKYYLQIYNQACNGYVVDEQITNRDYMNAQLENNNLKIGGKLASENEDIKKGLAKDNEDKLEQIKSWYKKETNSIKNEEKKIGLKQTSLQAEISALTTEQSSVQSLIDKNIERSFTYCQKG